jgi:hypothetical protein
MDTIERQVDLVLRRHIAVKTNVIANDFVHKHYLSIHFLLYLSTVNYFNRFHVEKNYFLFAMSNLFVVFRHKQPILLSFHIL